MIVCHLTVYEVGTVCPLAWIGIIYLLMAFFDDLVYCDIDLVAFRFVHILCEPPPWTTLP